MSNALIFVRKNKENVSYARFEVECLFNLLSLEANIEEDEDYFLIFVKNITKKDIEFLKKRIAYNKELGRVVIYRGEVIYKPSMPVRVVPTPHLKEILNNLEREGIALDINSRCKLKYFRGILYETLKEVKEKEFLARTPHHRPGFMPFSLSPRLTKSLFNIALVCDHHKVLDPFGGTGGTALEGMILGIRTFIMEKYKKVGQKAYANMKHYFGKCDNLVMGDAKYLPFKNHTFDALISDLPYGRSSKIEDVDTLYGTFMEEGRRVLKKGKRMVLITNISDLDKRYSGCIYKTSFYVHRTLTRYLYVFENM